MLVLRTCYQGLDKQDCFAWTRGKCWILSETEFEGQCPFYKTHLELARLDPLYYQRIQDEKRKKE